MESSLLLIIKEIHLNCITKCQKGVCGIQKSSMETKTHGIRRYGVNDGLGGRKGTGNKKSRHKTGVLLKKSQKNHKFFQCKISKTSQMGRCNQNHQI